MSHCYAKLRFSVNRKVHRKFAVGKKKKEVANQIGIYRENVTSGLQNRFAGKDESLVIRSGVSARVRQDRRVKHNWY